MFRSLRVAIGLVLMSILTFTTSGFCAQDIKPIIEISVDEEVHNMDFSPDNKTLAFGSTNGDDCSIKLWNIESKKCIATLQGHDDIVNSVTFSPDGRFLASGSHDASIKVWDMESKECLATLWGIDRGNVNSVAFSPDGKLIAYGSHYQVGWWDLKNEKPLAVFSWKTLGRELWGVKSVVFSPDGALLASGGLDDRIRLWNIENQKCVAILKDWFYNVFSLDFSPDGGTLASGSDDQTKFWDIESRECTATFYGKAVNSVAFSPDGTLLASGSEDKTIKLWDLKTNECIITLKGHTKSVNIVAFSPDGRFLASGSSDKTIKLWDVTLLQSSQPTNKPPVASFTFSPENPYVNVEVVFDASNSNDPDGSIVSYEWDLGDGTTANGQVAVHSYSTAGRYTVTLEVTDNNGAKIVTSEKIEVVSVAKLEALINAKLLQRPIYPPYLLDVDSFGSAVNTIWQDFTDWFRADDLTDNYDELYFTGIEYDSLKYTALIKARDFLNIRDIANAKKYLEKADTYEKVSQLSFQGASYVFEANLEVAETIARSIKEGCQASVRFGLKFVSPSAAKTADFLYDVLDLGIEYYFGNQDEATKDFLMKRAIKLLFNEVHFEKLGGKTVSDWIKNQTGKCLFPILTEITKSTEWQNALSEVIKEGVESTAEGKVIEVTNFIADAAAKAINSLRAELKSPAEIRVHNSQGQITGLVNGKLMNEIPASVYANEAVIIFFPTDVYRYEVVGTEKGKYGLEVVSIVEGNETTFLAADIPIQPRASHRYIVDWDALSKKEEGVTIEVDADGDGTFEHTATADAELTSKEYSAATSVTPSGKQFTTWGDVKQTKLFQNYPNPFNPETWIPYALAEKAKVVIEIYTSTGQLVRTLDLGNRPAGVYLAKEEAAYWDGCDDNDQPVSSGVYFYALSSGSFCETKKMVIVR